MRRSLRLRKLPAEIDIEDTQRNQKGEISPKAKDGVSASSRGSRKRPKSVSEAELMSDKSWSLSEAVSREEDLIVDAEEADGLFEVVGKVSEGTFSVVYKAKAIKGTKYSAIHDIVKSGYVALKRLHPISSLDRILSEIAILTILE